MNTGAQQVCCVTPWPQGVAVVLPKPSLSPRPSRFPSLSHLHRSRRVSSVDVPAVPRNSSQSQCVHLYSYAGISTPLHGAIICCVTDEGSRVQLMNICLVFMAFKYHERSRLCLCRYLRRR